MRQNSIKQKWRAGKVTIGGWLTISSSYSAEIMANQGFDWLCIDTQHGAVDYNGAFPMLQAISTTDTVPFVRVPWNEPSAIMKALDAGAYGVIVPMVNNRAEAEAAVRACRYPPLGLRSFGPNRVNFYAGAGYPENANDEIALAVMIETAEALENLDRILSTPGIDAAYIGPSDLNQALGLPPRQDVLTPRHQEAAFKILDACKRHDVVAGVHTWSARDAAHYAALGFQFIMLASDSVLMGRAAVAELDAFRQATA